MKKIAFAFALLMAASSQANLIEVGLVAQGGNSNPTTETGIINSALSTSGLVYLAKFDYGTPGAWDSDALFGDDEFSVGAFSGSPAFATVSWDLTGTGYVLSGVLVKTANTHYRVYSVEADQIIKDTNGQTVVSPPKFHQNVFKDQSSISHISFFGRRCEQGECSDVADTGVTLILLGFGLSLLGLVRRFIK